MGHPADPLPIVTLRADGVVSIRSRNGKDVTAAYPELHVRPPTMAGREGVFDGEVVAIDESARCSFQRLQRRMNVMNPSLATQRATPLSFVVFDVLWLAPIGPGGSASWDVNLVGCWVGQTSVVYGAWSLSSA